jgi:hypothetical protein
MNHVILDTHVWIWWVNQDDKLPISSYSIGKYQSLDQSGCKITGYPDLAELLVTQ